MNSDLKQLVMAVSLGCMGASPAFAGTSEYVTKCTSAQASKLLWPIDENTLGLNSQLHQTPGYEQ